MLKVAKKFQIGVSKDWRRRLYLKLLITFGGIWNWLFGTTNKAQPLKKTACTVLVIKFLCCDFRYHLKDVIVGKIYFLLVRIKIKHMELAIIKRETTGTGMDMLSMFFVGWTHHTVVWTTFVLTVIVTK